MKKPNITPGEWSHYNSKGGRIYQNWRVIDKRKICIAKIEELPGGESEMANAQAIAALPQCLDILNRILYASESPSGASCGEAKLCLQFKDEARSALIAAGYTE